MSEGRNPREIDLGDDFGEVVVKANGVQIKIGADGTIQGLRAAPKIGDEMADGTILAGYYEGKPFYATPADAPGAYSFNRAAKYASRLHAHGHRDFRVPDIGELKVLYENRDKGRLKGTFNESGSSPFASYWSSTPHGDCCYGGWTRRFTDGDEYSYFKNHASSLRCVRG